jgi:PIN domain nuclease of toxin-antitoxin system
MRLLFDTHAFLWWSLVAGKTPRNVLEALDAADEVMISPVTFWEIGLKAGGKGYDFHLPGDWETVLPSHAAKYQVSWLPISPHHCRRIQDLPFHHKNPFYRMLIAQALVENLTIIGTDEAFDAYGVRRLW